MVHDAGSALGGTARVNRRLRHAEAGLTDFCSDRELGYQRNRTEFTEGRGLLLDGTYRLAHLPLVAPDHPRAIPFRDGAFYSKGRHPRVFSLVLPVPGEVLLQSPSYRRLEAELRGAPFAGKIAWHVIEQRQSKLHATICGGLGLGDEAPRLEEQQLRRLARLGPIDVELRGLFSGNVNVGRLYLRAYPERRHDRNVFRQIQHALGRPETDLYVVGLWNLMDDLDIPQAAALGSMIERWWERPILRFRSDHLWLLGAADDLVLDSAVSQIVPLV